MECKHSWTINPDDPFPLVECKYCHKKTSLLDLTDEEIKESFGGCAEAMQIFRNVGQQYYPAIKSIKELHMSETYVCYKCDVELKRVKHDLYICPKCKFMLNQYSIDAAKRRRYYLEHPRRRNSHDFYNTLFREAVLKQKKTRYICPICKLRDVYKTKDGRLICANCLLTIKKTFLPGSLKEKVIKMYESGITPGGIVLETCLSAGTIFTILRRFR